MEGFLETARRVDYPSTISNPPTGDESIILDSGKRQHERYMNEVLPEHARISDPDEHQRLQRAPEQPGDREATREQSNPNKKRKSLASDGSGTAQRRSEPHRAPGAP